MKTQECPIGRLCPGCNGQLPTKRESETRCSGRVVNYTVLDLAQLVFCYGGLYWHRDCADSANIQDGDPANLGDELQRLSDERDETYRDHQRRFASCGCAVCRYRRAR